MSTLPALGGCAGALVTGDSGCTESPPSTGTSVTVERGLDSAAADVPRALPGDDFASPCSRFKNAPTAKATIASATNAPAPMSLLRARLSAGGMYAGEIGIIGAVSAGSGVA
jgi:hypothetical protein